MDEISYIDFGTTIFLAKHQCYFRSYLQVQQFPFDWYRVNCIRTTDMLRTKKTEKIVQMLQQISKKLNIDNLTFLNSQLKVLQKSQTRTQTYTPKTLILSFY